MVCVVHHAEPDAGHRQPDRDGQRAQQPWRRMREHRHRPGSGQPEEHHCNLGGDRPSAVAREAATLEVVVNALVERNKAEILSRPSILTLDNRQATIRVGTDIKEQFGNVETRVPPDAEW